MARLSDWLTNVEYELLKGNTEEAVSDVIYDSRKAKAGTVFVCMCGARMDAHDFISEVYEAGCRSFVVEKPLSEIELPPACGDINIIYTKSARRALSFMSAARFGNPEKKLCCIGITGTKGKTTAAYMLKAILERCGKRAGVIGTNGCEICGKHYETRNTTPESYELCSHFQRMLDAGCEYAVMECSSQGFKMHRTDFITFDYGIFLNISPDHIGPGEHADFAEYLSCKAKLLSQSKNAIVNLDDPHTEELLLEAGFGKDCAGQKLYTFSLKERNASLSAAELSYRADASFVGTEFSLCGIREGRISLSIPGDYNVSNALSVLLLAKLLGLLDGETGAVLSDLKVSGRMETVYRSDKFQVLIDYAHNEVSMEALIKTLRGYEPKRLVVVFGCGGNRSKERRLGMGKAAAEAADFSIFTADNSRYEKTEDIIAEIKEAYFAAGGSKEAYAEIPDRREAIRYAMEHAKEGDMIAVIGKGHEEYQEMNGVRTHFSDREVILETKELLGL